MFKIAVGVDFSPSSELAARQAVEVARHIGAEVILVHVAVAGALPVVAAHAADLRSTVGAYRALLDREMRRDRERLEAMRDALSERWPRVSTALAEGTADEGLSGAARDLGADLVVVGTHGRTGLRWLLLGSVAQRVVRVSPEDVLVARGDGAGRRGFHRVLAAVDFTPASARALDRAVSLASPDGSVDVVHFCAVPAAAELADASRWLGPPMVDAARAQGEELVARRRTTSGPLLRFHAAPEAPIPGIVQWLERQPFDLAALGSHGRRGVRRALMGSVAETVVRRATCSVLVSHAA